MPKQYRQLDLVHVSSPCTADWDAMVGNDEVRFCVHCNLNVHDLTQMTRKRAEQLVARSRGRLCIRYVRRPDGSLQTRQVPSELHQIKRRASKITAGAFSAVLSLAASASAETLPRGVNHQVLSGTAHRAAAVDDHMTANSAGSGTLSGVVVDPTGAVVPGASINLTNERSGVTQSATTDEEGRYQFHSLEEGSYDLEVTAPGFAKYTKKDVLMREGEELRVDATLEVGAITMGGAMVMIEPEEPIVNAAYKNDAATVKQLLRTGADVNARDKATGTLALNYAVSNGNSEMVQVLITAGAKADARSSSGRTALMELSEQSSADIVRSLVAVRADVNAKDDGGDSPLGVAASCDNLDVLQALIEAGADVNTRNGEGKTPLMIAAEAGYVRNVQALLVAGADIEAKDGEKQTALRIARENKHMEVVKLLESYGAIE